MDFKTLVNSVGILLTIIGVYIAFINSPINDYEIIQSFEIDKIKKESNRKNIFLKIGIYLVIIGSAIQLISNFIKTS